MASLATDFDPYRTWLGIQEPHRPLNPYQLLGLVPLETDVARIRAGFERQQAALAMWAGKADSELWETVQGELAQAYDLLGDAEQKAVLDAGIRRRTGGAKTANGKPSPATGAAATVACRQCQRQNPTGRRFCSGCGKPLWEQCPQCCAECAADEQFCGHCGADIRGGLAEQRRQLEERIEQALEMAAGHRYDAAVSALRGVAAVSDPRMEHFASRALEEITKIECDHKTFQRAAEDGLGQARRFMESYAYENAQHAIEDVPEPLRTQEHRDILLRAKSARQELLSLGGEIRQAVEQKKTWDLLPKLERLLALKPNHGQARELAEVLRDNLVKTAKTRLGEHRYREALDSLDQIPSFVRNSEVSTLSEAATELLSLLEAVRNAALADRQLQGLADRLCKLAASNAEAAKLRAQLMEKLKGRPANRRLGAPNWTEPPKRTRIGVPIDWLAHLTRPRPADDSVAEALDDHPGQVFTAFGL
ncbi:MAG TPA: zinc ribbon domain-containing protein, partial [Pirellulaceae bacterium]|nr:zinc ribbon domain-containing protein [Pirellulaceae bacterium]